ncbi:hypothetical protein ACFFX0_31250 [Citricoccus parietis]|uniref:Uncharacterized protein n=1 Tax=Citricoccus parietis TaxID=592307 RepID=A0ABV5G913_9MICC
MTPIIRCRPGCRPPGSTASPGKSPPGRTPTTDTTGSSQGYPQPRSMRPQARLGSACGAEGAGTS